METLDIRTIKFPNIHYRKLGDGPAVVLLHGFPEDGMLWEQIIPVLANTFRVIVPDIPGSGDSTLLNTDVSIEDLADSISDVLYKEQIQEAVIVGHSMGGYISLALAEKKPSLFKGLSLVHSIASADTEEKKEVRRKSIELIRKGGKEPFVKGMIPNLFSSHFKALHPEVVQMQIERAMRMKDESMIAFYNAMINRPDRTNILTGAGFPVQWIIGKEDNVVSLDSALQQSRKARINFVTMYNNCGHMSMLEQPERLANDLKEFIVFCYNR